jgi:hypothetical protein
MESSTPGLIAQLKEVPTRERYKIATILFDHATDFTFILFQTDTSSKQTLQAKVELERIARSHGDTIKHYHSDNGRFVDKSWREDTLTKLQSMSLCRVNAHHQNRKVERQIRSLQVLSRSSLMHTIKCGPDANQIFLWPYAMRNAVEDMNHIARITQLTTPIELFSNIKIAPNLNHKHTFGCPMYILDQRLQAGHKMSKWEARSRVALYIGPSTYHASNLGLGLSLTTGLVSPTFHAFYDDSFSTVTNNMIPYITKSQWQIKCGFQKETDIIRFENQSPI